MREKLAELLADFFGIDSPDGSYHYILNRVKTAFGLGTMRLDDFEEYDEDTVDEIVELLIDADVTIPVRCKDCVSCYKSESSSTGYRCKCWGVYDTDCECDPNGFCHKGERRKDGQTD